MNDQSMWPKNASRVAHTGATMPAKPAWPERAANWLVLTLFAAWAAAHLYWVVAMIGKLWWFAGCTVLGWLA